MDDSDRLLNSIAEIAEEFKLVQERAVHFYSGQVEDVINGNVKDARSIEAIMDGLLDFGDNLDCIELYETLSRHVCRTYPEMVKEHVWLLRAFHRDFDDEADKSNDQSTPNIGSL